MTASTNSMVTTEESQAEGGALGQLDGPSREGEPSPCGEEAPTRASQAQGVGTGRQGDDIRAAACGAVVYGRISIGRQNSFAQ